MWWKSILLPQNAKSKMDCKSLCYNLFTFWDRHQKVIIFPSNALTQCLDIRIFQEGAVITFAGMTENSKAGERPWITDPYHCWDISYLVSFFRLSAKGPAVDYLRQRGSHPLMWCHPQPPSALWPAFPIGLWRHPCCPEQLCSVAGQPEWGQHWWPVG